MKTKAFTPMGSLHPILFFVFVYVVALLFSVFICSSLFYSCNARPAKVANEEIHQGNKTMIPAATIALR
jgi:hypothetical protein